MHLFYWDDRNKAHVAEHGVDPEEAKEVAAAAAPPYPQDIGGGKWLVRGVTAAGRHLQVIYVWRPVEAIDLGLVDPDDRLLLADVDEVVYVIHSRDLTESERRAARKRGRRP